MPHISYKDENWQRTSLPKEDPKIYKSRDTPFGFFWNQHFFYYKLTYFSISRNADIDCIFAHNF